MLLVVLKLLDLLDPLLSIGHNLQDRLLDRLLLLVLQPLPIYSCWIYYWWKGKLQVLLTMPLPLLSMLLMLVLLPVVLLLASDLLSIRHHQRPHRIVGGDCPTILKGLLDQWLKLVLLLLLGLGKQLALGP